MIFLADIIIILHLLFVLFVILGGFLVLWKKGWAWLHIPAVLWGAVIELADMVCPLTPLENQLRLQGGGTPYTSDFIEHYLIPFLYPSFLTVKIQLILGLAVIVINVCIYSWVIRQVIQRTKHI